MAPTHEQKLSIEVVSEKAQVDLLEKYFKSDNLHMSIN